MRNYTIFGVIIGLLMMSSIAMAAPPVSVITTNQIECGGFDCGTVADYWYNGMAGINTTNFYSYPNAEALEATVFSASFGSAWAGCAGYCGYAYWIDDNTSLMMWAQGVEGSSTYLMLAPSTGGVYVAETLINRTYANWTLLALKNTVNFTVANGYYFIGFQSYTANGYLALDNIYLYPANYTGAGGAITNISTSWKTSLDSLAQLIGLTTGSSASEAVANGQFLLWTAVSIGVALGLPYYIKHNDWRISAILMVLMAFCGVIIGWYPLWISVLFTIIAGYVVVKLGSGFVGG